MTSPLVVGYARRAWPPAWMPANASRPRPAHARHLRTTWTRKWMGQHLGERLCCWLFPRAVGHLIQQLPFVGTRPKLATRRDDPEDPARKACVAAPIVEHPTAPRPYDDECDVHQVSLVRGQYQRAGTQTAIPTPGTNRNQAVCGFWDAVTGGLHAWLTERKRRVEFLTCLHALCRRYSTGPV